jgi:hypothetical protein
MDDEYIYRQKKRKFENTIVSSLFQSQTTFSYTSFTIEFYFGSYKCSEQKNNQKSDM